MPEPTLLAVSDLHVAYDENRALLETLRPRSDGDWLIVAGDVAEKYADVAWALRLLSRRFARVAWAPGNHELLTHPQDEAAAVVYGHLHSLRVTWDDGVRFEEVSVGYPRERAGGRSGSRCARSCRCRPDGPEPGGAGPGRQGGQAVSRGQPGSRPGRSSTRVPAAPPAR